MSICFSPNFSLFFPISLLFYSPLTFFFFLSLLFTLSFRFPFLLISGTFPASFFNGSLFFCFFFFFSFFLQYSKSLTFQDVTFLNFLFPSVTDTSVYLLSTVALKTLSYFLNCPSFSFFLTFCTSFYFLVLSPMNSRISVLCSLVTAIAS